MKTLKHLSPTGIALYEQKPEEFYMMYLADQRPPRIPQTDAMAVGSSFDAYCKSFMHEKLVGKDPKFEFQTIFEAQVEEHNRDAALKAGKECFEYYLKSGALADLMLEIQAGQGPPRFEFEVKGVIQGQREGITLAVEDLILLGKPDCFFVNKMGANVILDWKVNGYYSVWGASPMQGYVRLRELGKTSKPHKECNPTMHKGIMINHGGYLEKYNADWARQLAIYGWLCGQAIGSDFIVAIDQIVCRSGQIRVAEHRCHVSEDFQWKTFAKAQQIWELAKSDHFFRDLSIEESKNRCLTLDGVGIAMQPTGDSKDDWFRKVTRE